MLLTTRSSSSRDRSVVRSRITAWIAPLVLLLATAGCGGYSGPPDIETARAGLRPEHRIVYEGEDGKTALELLEETAESVVTEGRGDELLVTAINGIDGGTEGRYWLYYVNGEAALIAASRMNTVKGDAVEWLFVR
jgi:hypothetical protein